MTEKALPVHHKPALSVIIASYNARRTIERCLVSLRTQTTQARFETIVVDSSTDGTAHVVERRFPEVRLYRFSQRMYCGGARNLGISVAQGEIIALIDADCEAASDWIDQILTTHEYPDLAIGGAIANGGDSSTVAWGAYFCEFSHWMPGTPSAWMDDIAGANMSYKKQAFDEFGPFIEGTYSSDTDFHCRLAHAGHPLRFVPRMVVTHHSIHHLQEYLRHEFHHGRSYALVRLRAQRFTPFKRLTYVILSPLLPLKLSLKVVTNNFRNRVYLSRFLRALPLTVLGIASWSLGELVGYAGGWKGDDASQQPRPGR